MSSEDLDYFRSHNVMYVNFQIPWSKSKIIKSS